MRCGAGRRLHCRAVAARRQADPGAAAQGRHWRASLVATAGMLVVWAAATFVPVYWARDLNRIDFFGWPLAFYMAAQGTLIVYLVLVWLYAEIMDRVDRRYHAARRKGQPGF
jgi:putative solute:sodium symporter small subunit